MKKSLFKCASPGVLALLVACIGVPMASASVNKSNVNEIDKQGLVNYEEPGGTGTTLNAAWLRSDHLLGLTASEDAGDNASDAIVITAFLKTDGRPATWSSHNAARLVSASAAGRDTMPYLRSQDFEFKFLNKYNKGSAHAYGGRFHGSGGQGLIC